MSNWSARRFNAEVQTLAAVVAHTGGDFTIGEAGHWVMRLDDAARKDFSAWHDSTTTPRV